MRPTDLHFRSPREKTAEFLYPVLTSDGHRIPVMQPETTKGSFSKSRRFPQYEEHAKKTGYRVGPGAYEINQSSIGRANIKGTPGYHKVHGGKDLANNGYIYVGNSVLFDPTLAKKKITVIDDADIRVDATQVLNMSPESRVRKSLQDSGDSFKKVPWYLRMNNTQNEFREKSVNSAVSNSRKRSNNNLFTKTLKTSPKFY